MPSAYSEQIDMSKGDASKDPVHFKVKVNSGPSRDETVIAGLSELGQLARHAFEDKRRKQCLALTTAILKIDPENKEALVIQAWVREDLVKDVTSARQQVEEARRENSLGLWDRAERLLRGVINVDPDHEEAKALLGEVVPAQRALAEANPIDDDAAGDGEKKSNRSRLIAVIVFGVVATALVIFFAFRPPPKPEASEEQKEDSAAAKPTPAPADAAETGSFEFYVLPQQGVQLSVDAAPAKAVPSKLDLPPGPHTLAFTLEGYAPQTLNETIIAGQNRAVPVILKATSTAAAPPEKKSDAPPKSPVPPKTATSSRGSTATQQPASNTSANPGSAVESEGSLAISSTVPVDVFLGGKILGTTPTTVKLPAGAQTLEYRFQSQSKSASYLIRANETTTATVSFDVTIQIQAFPWAEVLIDGPGGKSLGQTPLSNVVITAGSWLVFKNPSFPEEKRRVTGSNPAIVVKFQ